MGDWGCLGLFRGGFEGHLGLYRGIWVFFRGDVGGVWGYLGFIGVCLGGVRGGWQCLGLFRGDLGMFRAVLGRVGGICFI